MTPAEMLASTSPRIRKRGRETLRDRLRNGWDGARALSEPIAKRGANLLGGHVTAYVERDGTPLAEIADELGLSRERVRQIEASALAKLRVALEAEGLTADDVHAWLDAKAGHPDHVSESRGRVGAGRRLSGAELAEMAAARVEAADDDEPSEAALYLQRVEAAIAGLDSIAERAAAHRMVERVVCGMEIAGGAW